MSNTYRLSTGERVSKSTIDSRVRAAKRRLLEGQFSEYGYNFCEECGRNSSSGVYLDCSHDVSVYECQKSGRSELAYDEVNNMKVRCRICHQKKDGLDLKWSK